MKTESKTPPVMDVKPTSTRQVMSNSFVGNWCWEFVLRLGLGTRCGARCGDSVLGLGAGTMGTRFGESG